MHQCLDWLIAMLLLVWAGLKLFMNIFLKVLPSMIKSFIDNILNPKTLKILAKI